MKSAFLNLLLVGLFFLSGVAMAAELDDVKVLKVSPGKDSIEVMMQLKEGPANSYFLVDIVKDDKAAYDKLLHVLKKQQQKGKYRLDLKIASFSDSPSGSYYVSTEVAFTGAQSK
ncbi:MAG: hypothetical protein H6624_12590 [Bdellovibrionaceae bacterium]|nr:hypothetical protein [Bdellovibrionales bacterium]MCB9085182.1 hypothetical protein [Pseudobdellovibrionaceae bacterium]